MGIGNQIIKDATFSTSSARAQVYPIPQIKQKYEKLVDDPDYEPERQCLGHSISVVLALLAIIISLPLIMRSIFEWQPVHLHALPVVVSLCFTSRWRYFLSPSIWVVSLKCIRPGRYLLLGRVTLLQMSCLEPDEAASYIAMDSALAFSSLSYHIPGWHIGKLFLVSQAVGLQEETWCSASSDLWTSPLSNWSLCASRISKSLSTAPAQDRPGRQ